MALPPLFFGTLREHYIMLFSAAGLVGLGMGFVGAWFGGWLGARRAIRSVPDQQHEAATARQLEPVMQALDAIALEVERVSEAQRFATRLLSERTAPSALPRSEPKSITPH